MILEAVAVMVFVGVIYAIVLRWHLPWIVDRAIKHVLIQQRLLDHSERVSGVKSWNEAEIAAAALPWAKGAEHDMRSLRYTEGHRQEAKRLRALEAEQAKIETGEPVSQLDGIAVGRK